MQSFGSFTALAGGLTLLVLLLPLPFTCGGPKCYSCWDPEASSLREKLPNVEDKGTSKDACGEGEVGKKNEVDCAKLFTHNNPPKAESTDFDAMLGRGVSGQSTLNIRVVADTCQNLQDIDLNSRTWLKIPETIMMRVKDSCIRLWDGEDCTGRKLELKATENEQMFQLGERGWSKTAVSWGSCDFIGVTCFEVKTTGGKFGRGCAKPKAPFDEKPADENLDGGIIRYCSTLGSQCNFELVSNEAGKDGNSGGRRLGSGGAGWFVVVGLGLVLALGILHPSLRF